MAKTCCRPTTSGDDLDPGGAGTIHHFKAQVARLEAAIRAKDAALRAAMSHFGLAAWIIHAQRFPKTTREEVKVVQQMQAALSDHAGKDWLEVREQVLRTGNRLLEEIHRRAMPSPPYTAIDEFRATLDALKGVK